MGVESAQEAVTSFLYLFPLITPALLISAIFCFRFRKKFWIAPFWVFAAFPVLVLFLLLIDMLLLTGEVHGPDGGFVAMGTMFILAGSLVEVIPGFILIFVCWPRGNWLVRTWPFCVLAVGLSIGVMYLGVLVATVPPASTFWANQLADKYQYTQKVGSDIEGFRHRAYVDMLLSPKTPVSTLTKIGMNSSPFSRNWQYLARNSSLPRTVIEAKISEPLIALEFARNPKILPEYLKIMATSPDAQVRDCVARNISTPKESLDVLTHDKDSSVQNGARKNLAGTLGDWEFK